MGRIVLLHVGKIRVYEYVYEYGTSPSEDTLPHVLVHANLLIVRCARRGTQCHATVKFSTERIRVPVPFG
jgi:hypothetical protein